MEIEKEAEDEIKYQILVFLVSLCLKNGLEIVTPARYLVNEIYLYLKKIDCSEAILHEEKRREETG